MGGTEVAPSVEKNEGVKLPTTANFNHSMEPRDFSELKDLAKILAASDIVPKDLIGKPANVLLVLMFGREVGLSSAQALQNVMVVNGRPSMWGDAVIGKVQQSGLMEFWKDSFDEKTMTATFTVMRKGSPEPTVRTFSQADAQKAGLWTKAGPWTQYPKRMLFQRARAFALRDTFADVLKGLRIVEEERDIIEVARQADGSYAMPKAAEEKKEEPARQCAEPAPAQPAEKSEAKIWPSGKEEEDDEGSTSFVPVRVAKDNSGRALVLSPSGEAFVSDDKKMIATAETAIKNKNNVIMFFRVAGGEQIITSLELEGA